MSRASWWLAGAMCGWALLVEDARRRTELTMYVLPRALESAWIVLRGKGVLPFVPGGDSLVSQKISCFLGAAIAHQFLISCALWAWAW